MGISESTYTRTKRIINRGVMTILKTARPSRSDRGISKFILFYNAGSVAGFCYRNYFILECWFRYV